MEIHLHPGQGRVFRARHQRRFRVVVAGRRWGKSTLANAELAIAGSQAPAGSRFWYVAPTWELARDCFWGPIRQMIPRGWISGLNSSRMELMLRSGVSLQGKTAQEPDNLRGRGLSGVVLDEYADMDKATFPEIIRPALADTLGWALFIGTPRSFNHFYDLFSYGTSSQDSAWQSWQFKTRENPYMKVAEIEDARRTTDPRTFRQEWEASFETVSGRAYYAFARATHVKPVVLNPALPVCCSFDFNVEPATAIIGQRDGQIPRVWREVRLAHRGGEATRAAAKAVKAHLDGVNYRGQVRIYGDATGKNAKTTGPADHAVLREIFPGAIWCIPVANPHEHDRVAAVNSCCETISGIKRLEVDPSCPALIADLEQVVLDVNGEIDKRTNPDLTHLSDALGYWLCRDFPPAPKTMAGSMRVEWLL